MALSLSEGLGVTACRIRADGLQNAQKPTELGFDVARAKLRIFEKCMGSRLFAWNQSLAKHIQRVVVLGEVDLARITVLPGKWRERPL